MAPKQVQGEMGVMGCDWCHFVIWIEGGLYVKERDSWADIWVRRRPFLVEKKRFYWPGYHQDSQQCCGECAICATQKSLSHSVRDPLSNMKPGQPMQLASVGILGLILSHKGCPNRMRIKCALDTLQFLEHTNAQWDYSHCVHTLLLKSMQIVTCLE